MGGIVDLHAHWLPAIDDGVRTHAEGVELLRALGQAGVTVAVATPHMRPGMFENDQANLRKAFSDFVARIDEEVLPELHLGCEHFFGDVVFDRLRKGEGVPYTGGGAVLVELPPQAFPARLDHRFFDLRRVGLTPVLAHPERYTPVWNDDACLDPLLDAGACLLLDVGALVGMYGRRPQRAAEKLLDEEAYEAACSDAHKPADVEKIVRAMDALERRVGKEESVRLLQTAPRALLEKASPRSASRASAENLLA